MCGGGSPLKCGADEELALVDVYHAALLDGGVRGYAPARCRRDYELARVHMLQRLIGVGDSIDFAGERGGALIATWIERVAARLAGVRPDETIARDGG